MRRALLRGVLPACLAILVFPVSLEAAVWVLFFALVGTGLSLVDIVTEARSPRAVRGLGLGVMGAALYVAAGLQAAYAHAFLRSGSVERGLQSVHDTLAYLGQRDTDNVPRYALAGFFAVCAGHVHATVVAAVAPRRGAFLRRRVAFAVVLLAVFLLVGRAVSAGDAFSSAPGAVAALITLAIVVSLCMAAPLVIATLVCDELESAFWPARAEPGP